ncbi:MAG: nickel pincer cofactor biosynthesis protein LarB [Candidatus Omnitrophica bacterium]|nr:nickel pincer cofactor biosynthesis protein LarB [Candidatus Omnitrophota bacterium]
MKESLKKLLEKVNCHTISVEEALEELKWLPYKDLGFAKVDSHRSLRRGIPEVIFCQGKTARQIEDIACHILSHSNRLLLTRLDAGTYRKLKKTHRGLQYSPAAKVAYMVKKQEEKKGSILIVTAGTGDLPVAEEAAITCDVLGSKVEHLYDVGVAGIHRLLDQRSVLSRANVIIVVAGMEGALPSVVSGLVSVPVVAVPTSIGYGASFGGIAPLLTMLNSCSPGVAVVNIDNGFGAGYFAHLINSK